MKLARSLEYSLPEGRSAMDQGHKGNRAEAMRQGRERCAVLLFVLALGTNGCLGVAAQVAGTMADVGRSTTQVATATTSIGGATGDRVVVERDRVNADGAEGADGDPGDAGDPDVEAGEVPYGAPTPTRVVHGGEGESPEDAVRRAKDPFLPQGHQDGVLPDKDV